MSTAVDNRITYEVTPAGNCKYVWLGELEKGIADREKFEAFVDYLHTREITMSERFSAADSLARYYTEVTGEQPPEIEMKRLFDWVRIGYDPIDYPHLTDAQLARRKKYEVLARVGDAEGLIKRDSQRLGMGGTRKLGMIPFSHMDPFEPNNRD